LKVDVMIASDSAFDTSRFSRGQRIKTAGQHEAWFASPEDVILKKLLYFREGGSEKHLRDIVGVLKVQAEKLDRNYIADWLKSLDVENEWRLALSRLTPAGQGGA
jgi:hypothetical protein